MHDISRRRAATVVAVAAIVAGAIGLVSTADAAPQQTSADMVALCQAAQRGNLSSADRTWAQRCVRVLTEGGRVLGSATPTPTPSLPSPTSSGSPGPSPTTGPPSPTPTPTSSPSPSPVGAWPGPANTGIPAGTVLTTYTGPCIITTPGTVIDAKTVNCDLTIQAANVTIRRSKVLGEVTNFSGPTATVLIEDTEIDAGTRNEHAVGNQFLTVRRANIHGNRASISCAFACFVEDSWLHGQYAPVGAGWHVDGVLSNGGYASGPAGNHFRHNTIACDAPDGCSGNVGLFGDDAPINGWEFDRNWFVSSNASNASASSYCLYAGSHATKNFPHASNMVYTGNVFERGDNGMCAHHGAVTDYEQNPGNQWVGNLWDDGTVLQP